MSKLKMSKRADCLKAWMTENKFPKVKLTTTQPTTYGKH
jgi:hypothetical protein